MAPQSVGPPFQIAGDGVQLPGIGSSDLGFSGNRRHFANGASLFNYHGVEIPIRTNAIGVPTYQMVAGTAIAPTLAGYADTRGFLQAGSWIKRPVVAISQKKGRPIRPPPGDSFPNERSRALPDWKGTWLGRDPRYQQQRSAFQHQSTPGRGSAGGTTHRLAGPVKRKSAFESDRARTDCACRAGKGRAEVREKRVPHVQFSVPAACLHSRVAQWCGDPGISRRAGPSSRGSGSYARASRGVAGWLPARGCDWISAASQQ